MKSAIVLGFALGLASANINFNERLKLSCRYGIMEPVEGITGCLRGYACQSDGTCKRDLESDLYPTSFRRDATPVLKRQAKFSQDGKCGPNNGGLVCDPNSTVYKGGCCSSAGWCGNTDAHCGAGCVSGCTGGNNGGGNTGGGGATADGTCGAQNAGKTCKGWKNGECCSMYGFCGNQDAHCGAGCQGGPCKGGTVIPGPGPSPAPNNPNPGSIRVVSNRAGVPAMHAGLMTNGRVVFLDRVEDNTQLRLPNGQFAYSAEYNPADNAVVPLAYKTNAFCSGGAFLPDGRMVSLGGNDALAFLDPTVGNGFRGIRYLSRSKDSASLNGKSWSEPGNKLASNRWYPSAQVMPDGRIFVASGSLNGADPSVKANNNPTYEMLSKTGVTEGRNIQMDILVRNQPYYMYPFVHLLRDGNLFVFTARDSETYAPGRGTIKRMPECPGDFRTYPNGGGSLLLPLSSKNNWEPSVMVCGGGVVQDINSPTDPSCGRINPLAANPKWEMDSMPEGRGMVEGVLLPDGTTLWINGANHGAEGFGVAKDPTRTALLYNPEAALGRRWSKGPTSGIARLYHSVALLLLDGTVMIAGSNPTETIQTTPVKGQTPSRDYVTEFRVEKYTPPYLSGANANKRPHDMVLSTKAPKVGGTFTMNFVAPTGGKAVKVALYHGGYVTHAVHMGHRMAFLDTTGFKANVANQKITVHMPPNHNVAPPGPYVVYVLVDGVPANGQFVMVA